MWNCIEPAVTICGEGKTGAEIDFSDVRKIVQDLGNTHPATEIIENICYCQPRSPDAGFATADRGINGNALKVIHGNQLAC